jgi:hypothetical protein
MPSQIVVLQMQSKLWISKAAMQGLHDVWQNFVMFVSILCSSGWAESLFGGAPSFSASAKGRAGRWPGYRKALADVPFSC